MTEDGGQHGVGERVSAAAVRALEASLHAAGAWQRAILDSAELTIISTDPAGVIQTFNAMAERVLGYQADEVIGKATPQLIHDPEEVRRRAEELSLELGRRIEPGFEVFVAHARSGRSEEREWTYLRKDGGRVPVRLTVTALFDHEGSFLGYLGVGLDLRERRRQRAQHRLHTVALEAAANAIVIANRAGTIEWTNAAWDALTGYSQAEVLGKTPRILKSGVQGPEFYRELWATIVAGQVWRGVLVNRRKDGTLYTEEETITPVRGESGAVTHFIAVKQDITARELAAQALRTSEEHARAVAAQLAVEKERAEAADRLKSVFLATMSHELRTPLNSILGFTGVLLQGFAGALNEEQAKQLDMVRTSARHLLSLINDVLDVSKIEAGQLDVYPRAFDLRASVQKLLAGLQPTASVKGLELRAELDERLGVIVSDQRRVEQVLLNLLSNAIKFTDQGHVTLEAKVVDRAPPSVQLCVVDTGIGIQHYNLERLFRPFTQLESGLSRNHEGTGLGLSICQRLARLLGGDVEVASEWGRGSRFTLTLPLSPAAQGAS